MPIRPPAIADLGFDQLSEELVSRIPAHTPEWTNPRVGDPGRTLIDLFAWLGDALLYRANLIPERQRLAFLQLLGTGLRPAVPARGLVTVSFGEPTRTTPVALRPYATVSGTPPFEATEEFSVLPVSGECYCKRILEPDEERDLGEVLEGLQSVYNLQRPPRAYVATRLFVDGAPQPEGFDLAARTIDKSLWIALLAPKVDKERQSAAVSAVRTALKNGIEGAPVLANLGLVPLLKLPERFDELPARVPLPLIWEASVALESGALEMLELSVRDGTQGLVRQGIVRAALPTRLALSAPANDVRANLRAGVGDTPPRIDDPERSARLVGWLRMRPRLPAQVASLALSWAGVNAIAIEQRQSVFGRVIGVSDASPGQSFQLPGTSVERATLELEVEEGGSFQRWQCVDDFATLERNPSVAREARAFVLDAEAGVLRFGDGVRGRVPERGARIRAARLRFGGGRAGNLPRGTLAKLSATSLQGEALSNLKLQQPMALAGGEDAETLAQAEQRIPARLRHCDRVVTPEDHRRLTLDTPGVQVGRVEVLPRFKPQQRRAGVPGVVSVMALPAQPVGEPPNPRPDRVFLETVHAWLDARRPLATELYVIGCEYVPLGIALAVEIREGFEQDGVLQAVRDALRRLLWPLAPGGPQSGIGTGEGWPLGRSVRDREVEVEVSRVAGVASVSQINLFRRSAGRWEPLPALDACGAQQLDLEAWQLPELLGVVVVPGVTAPADLRTPPAEVDPDAVGVPVVPEVC